MPDDFIQGITLPNGNEIPIKPAALSDGTHILSLPSVYSDGKVFTEIFSHEYHGYNTSATGANGSFDPTKTVDNNIIGASESHATCAFYFGVLKADNYYKPCQVTYEFEIWCPANNNYRAIITSHVDIYVNTYTSYANWNAIYSTSYRPVYYSTVYSAKQAGVSTYGHALGFNLIYSTNYTSSSLYRYVKIRVLDVKNGTFEYYRDTAGTPVLLKYASIPGTGSTYYQDIRNFNALSTGLQETGDSDSAYRYGIYDYYFRPYVGAEAIYRYKLVALGKDNRLVPMTITNQTDSTQVAKVPTQVAFRPEKIWLYNSSTAYSAGAVFGAQILAEIGYNSVGMYNFNTTIPAYRLIYLRGHYNQTTGLFTLYKDSSSPCTSYYVAVPDNTANITLSDYFVQGYDYILVGSTYSTADYMSLFANNPMYLFDGTNLIQYDKNNLQRDLVVSQKTSSANGAYMTASAFNTSPPAGVTGQVLFVIQGE